MVVSNVHMALYRRRLFWRLRRRLPRPVDDEAASTRALRPSERGRDVTSLGDFIAAAEVGASRSLC